MQTRMEQVDLNLGGFPLEVGTIGRDDNGNQTQTGDTDVMIQSGLSEVPIKDSIKEIVYGSITQVQTRTQTKTDQQR